MFAIAVPLAPFELDGEAVETEVVIENIEADVGSSAALAGQTLTLPTNPEPGYADGSIYILHAHVPFDVTQIAFGDAVDGVVKAEMSGRFVPEYEGLGYRDQDLALQVRLRMMSTE